MSEGFLSGRLSHALLLTGVTGVGKRAFAQRLATAVLCERGDGEVCGVCPNCRRMAGGAHPGFTALRRDEDKRDIAIDAVRELCATLAMTSHDGRAKIALIDPVDALNQNGVNALLKTLEEPSPGSLLLLISERPMALPATLRSRCQMLRFGLPGDDLALSWLAQQCPQASTKDLELALSLARGAPLCAVELLTDGETIETYSGWTRLMQDLNGGQTDALQAAAAIGRNQVPTFLPWLAVWVLEQLRADIAAERAQSLARFGEAVNEAIRRLQGNANPQLLLESLLIGWSGTLARMQRVQ